MIKQINKTINLSATIYLKGDTEVPVANLNANIGENKLNYNINCNIINEAVINLNEVNKNEFIADKQAFEAEVKSHLLI